MPSLLRATLPRSGRIRAAATLTAVLVLLAPGCGDPAPQRNLLLVTFDTLRADRTGVYGNTDWGRSTTPQLDRLAARGTVFERALAPRGQTHPSLASMLSGKYPITTGVRENGHMLLPEHRTVIEHLREAGWQTGVFLANFDVGLEGDSWAFRGALLAGDGYRGRRAQEARNESRFQREWDDRVEETALSFFERIDRNRPWAAWVHFYDIHKPFNPPPGHDLYGHSEGLPEALVAPGPDSGAALEAHLREITLGEREVPAAELRRILGLYDGAVTATDARLGRLLDRLEQLGELEHTYIVFSSDHGEELYEHNRYFFHGASIYDATLRIPLVIVGPGLPAGRRLPQTVQIMDIAPTVLDLLGLELPEDHEGRTLVPLLTGASSDPPRPYAFIEWQDVIYSVADGRWSYIHNPQHVHPAKPPYYVPGSPPTRGFPIDCFEAYDLQGDPRQQHNLLEQGTVRRSEDLPEHIRPLLAALSAWLADPRHERSMSQPGLSLERLEQLRALGYVGGGFERDDLVYGEPCH